MGNLFDTSIPTVTTQESSTVRSDLVSLKDTVTKLEEVVGILGDIVIKLNGATIRSALKLSATEPITESHLYKWSKM